MIRTAHNSQKPAKAEPFTNFDERLVGSNVNANSYLATDYLNHFNEVVMLLEMLEDMPEMAEDACHWQPSSYVEHFERSGLADRDVVIEAYYRSPNAIRLAFDTEVAKLNLLLSTTLAQLELMDSPKVEPQVLADISARMSRLNTLIHGHIPNDVAVEDDGDLSDQSAIDALFD